MFAMTRWLVTAASLSLALLQAQEPTTPRHLTHYLTPWNGHLVVSLQLDPGWHIYWKNSGDSGIPTKILWSWNGQKQGAPVPLELPWPVPTTFKEGGNLWTYGHARLVHFFYSTAPLQGVSDLPKELTLAVEYLICKEICLPGKITQNVTWPLGEAGTGAELSGAALGGLELAFKALPQIVTAEKLTTLPLTWQWYRIPEREELVLDYQWTDHPSAEAPQAQPGQLAYPLFQAPLNPGHEERQNPYLARLRFAWDGAYQDPVQLLPTSAIGTTFNLPNLSQPLLIQDPNNPGRSWEVRLPLTGIKTLDELLTLPSIESRQSSTSTSFLAVLLLALLGGIILNLMPCVLPVVSLKLYGLIDARSAKQRWPSALSYTGGVMFCFLLLAVITRLLAVLGQEVGWGFQLQSPTFTWCMALLFFILALSYFDVLYLNVPGRNWLSNLSSKHPLINDFFTGLVSVVVATPCSAPFMGAALSYALQTQWWWESMAIFMCLGLGLSAPFLLLAMIPSLGNRLPKPGQWMNQFKYLLGLALLCSSAWLLDLLFAQVSDQAFIFLITIATLWFALTRTWAGKRPSNMLLFAYLLCSYFLMNSFIVIYDHHYSSSTEQAVVNTWHPWSSAEQEKINQQPEQLYFIDFTAQWCITCQVNKKLVMETQAFSELTSKLGIKKLRADWTKPSPDIQQWLKAQQVVSIPAYFLGKGNKVIFLGETISLEKIEQTAEQLNAHQP